MHLIPQCITVWTDAAVTKSKDHCTALFPAMQHCHDATFISATGDIAHSIMVHMLLIKLVTVSVGTDCAEENSCTTHACEKISEKVKAPVEYITGKIHYLPDMLWVRCVTCRKRNLQALLPVG